MTLLLPAQSIVRIVRTKQNFATFLSTGQCPLTFSCRGVTFIGVNFLVRLRKYLLLRILLRRMDILSGAQLVHGSRLSQDCTLPLYHAPSMPCSASPCSVRPHTSMFGWASLRLLHISQKLYRSREQQLNRSSNNFFNLQSEFDINATFICGSTIVRDFVDNATFLNKEIRS